MPMELLSRLCKASMPCRISDEDDIEKLVVLRAARLLEADIPSMVEDGGLRWYSGPALVHRVSEEGVSAASGRATGRFSSAAGDAARPPCA